MSQTKFAKPYDVRWPVTPQLIEDINANFDAIFRILRSGIVGSSSSSTAATSIHNDLDGLQGGAASEYYHVTHQQYDGQWDALGAGVAPEVGSALKVDGHAYIVQYDAGSSGAAKTIDWQNGNVQTLELSATTTLTFSNPKAGGQYLLRLKQGTGAPFTVTWPGTVVWAGDVEPTLGIVENDLDLIAFYWDGSAYIGAGAMATSTSSLPENPLAVAHGGTGFFGMTEGLLLVGNAGGTLNKLDAPTVTGQVLTADTAIAGKMAWTAPTAKATVSVYLSSDTTANDSTEKRLDFDAELWDDYGFHDNLSNPSRLTVPASRGGVYLCIAGVEWGELFLGTPYIRIYVNGSLVVSDVSTGNNVAAPNRNPHRMSVLLTLAAGDYVEVKLYCVMNTGGTTIAVYGGSMATFAQLAQVA